MIDKTQPICYDLIPLWFLIQISLFDSTVVTEENSSLRTADVSPRSSPLRDISEEKRLPFAGKENLHLKNNSKLTTMSLSKENEN